MMAAITAFTGRTSIADCSTNILETTSKWSKFKFWMVYEKVYHKIFAVIPTKKKTRLYIDASMTFWNHFLSIPRPRLGIDALETL